MKFQKLALPLALLVTVASLGAFAPAASALEEPVPQSVLLRNLQTGKFLTVANHDTSSGTAVLYDADGAGNGNIFSMAWTDDGQVCFTVPDSSAALTVNSSGKLVLDTLDSSSVFQKFDRTQNGNAFQLTAGGQALTPDGQSVTMQTAGEASDWEIIYVLENSYTPGDLNQDGAVDIYDLALMKRLLLNGTSDPIERAVANVDTSEAFNVADAVCLTKHLLGLDAPLGREVTDGSGSVWAASVFTENTIFPAVEIVPEETSETPEETTEPATEPETEAQGIIWGNSYTTPEDVAEYLHVYNTLPSNFLTKKEAQALGWESSLGNLWDVAPGMSIGGDYFGNREGLLPDGSYHECDVNYNGGYRGAERLVFSTDGRIYYTNDHYQTFRQLY